MENNIETQLKSSPNPESVIRSLIDKQGFAWCGVSDDDDEEAREQGKYCLLKIVKVVDHGKFGFEFYLENETYYIHAVPFDPNTLSEITNLVD